MIVSKSNKPSVRRVFVGIKQHKKQKHSEFPQYNKEQAKTKRK